MKKSNRKQMKDFDMNRIFLYFRCQNENEQLFLGLRVFCLHRCRFSVFNIFTVDKQVKMASETKRSKKNEEFFINVLILMVKVIISTSTINISRLF